ncbi:MAG: glycosyltransferase family 4 protein [Candidatus Aminicenantes bacterium]|nr:glycosyltransferase family 4 protein [Candidatus Aminicenantes bacterium]
MSHKIKVVHIITRFDKGGSAENTFLTLDGMDKSRYEVTLISGKEDDPTQGRSNQIWELRIEHIPIPELRRNINLVNDWKAFLKIRRILKYNNFTIVHTHTSKAGFLGRIAARAARTPIIIHTPHGHVLFGYFGRMKTLVFKILEKFTVRITDIIIALTKREKEDYVAAKMAKRDKITVIHSGIELEKCKNLSIEEKQALKKTLHIPEGALIVGTAGRLVQVKGPEILIRAAEKVLRKHPDVYFLFAGDGDQREALSALADRLGIKKNIVFLGWRNDLVEILSLYDIFVLPSLNEGMGRVLVEAMALGKPIVASNICGIPDLIQHGKNGFLVPPQNPEELAHHIQILLEDKHLRIQMGVEGKKLAPNYSAKKMVEQIESLYSLLLKNMKTSL